MLPQSGLATIGQRHPRQEPRHCRDHQADHMHRLGHRDRHSLPRIGGIWAIVEGIGQAVTADKTVASIADAILVQVYLIFIRTSGAVDSVRDAIAISVH